MRSLFPGFASTFLLNPQVPNFFLDSAISWAYKPIPPKIWTNQMFGYYNHCLENLHLAGRSKDFVRCFQAVVLMIRSFQLGDTQASA